MRRALIVLWMLLGSATSQLAQVSVGIGSARGIGITCPCIRNWSRYRATRSTTLRAWRQTIFLRCLYWV